MNCSNNSSNENANGEKLSNLRPILLIVPGLLFILLLCFPVINMAEPSSHHSSYAGQEKRSIKSLSEDDIVQLKAGQGWGLAKAAELNGVPGPIHLLEMKNEIKLNSSQVKQITHIYQAMNKAAKKLGKRLITAEKDLNNAFSKNAVDKNSLDQKLTTIAKIRKELRFAHLAAHLDAAKIVTSQQVSLYNKLRGYDNSDPCANIPAGHNEEMWRKHNNCN